MGDSGTLHNAAGDTSTALPVTIKGDGKDESNETLRVFLSNGAGATLHRSRGTVTILDDDPYIPPATTTTPRDTPFQVGGPSSWTDLALGVAHSCGISSPGTLWCWGANDYGQLGDNTTGDRHSPHQVGSATNWTSVATGSYHSCAIRGTGMLWCWGRNNYGELGDGTTDDRHAPVRIGAASDWYRISAASHHTAGIRS